MSTVRWFQRPDRQQLEARINSEFKRASCQRCRFVQDQAMYLVTLYAPRGLIAINKCRFQLKSTPLFQLKRVPLID